MLVVVTLTLCEKVSPSSIAILKHFGPPAESKER